MQKTLGAILGAVHRVHAVISRKTYLNSLDCCIGRRRSILAQLVRAVPALGQSLHNNIVQLERLREEVKHRTKLFWCRFAEAILALVRAVFFRELPQEGPGVRWTTYCASFSLERALLRIAVISAWTAARLDSRLSIESGVS